MPPKSVLAIVAHADDMEFMAGGTIARMADLGYSIREVIATNNERGTLAPDWGARLADTRREEARRGALNLSSYSSAPRDASIIQTTRRQAPLYSCQRTELHPPVCRRVSLLEGYDALES